MGKYPEPASNWRAYPRLGEREVALVDIGEDPWEQFQAAVEGLCMNSRVQVCLGLRAFLPRAVKCGKEE
jgi:hypothetical protein